MNLVYNYYLHTDIIFPSFLSIYVRVSVLGRYLMEPNVFKVADALCHLLLLGCACGLCVTSPLFAAVGGAVWRFSVFIFLIFYYGCLYFMLLSYSCWDIKVKHFPLLDPVPKIRCLINFCNFFCNVFSILTALAEFYFILSCMRFCSRKVQKHVCGT
jgi:hypothetical protein